jgi:GST-like protein
VAGDSFIADMACWPWIVLHDMQSQRLEDFPHLWHWFEVMKTRPAVQRGFEVGREFRTPSGPDEEAKKILFGQKAMA